MRHIGQQLAALRVMALQLGDLVGDVVAHLAEGVGQAIDLVAVVAGPGQVLGPREAAGTEVLHLAGQQVQAAREQSEHQQCHK
jgi:hypothetical protein